MAGRFLQACPQILQIMGGSPLCTWFMCCFKSFLILNCFEQIVHEYWKPLVCLRIKWSFRVHLLLLLYSQILQGYRRGPWIFSTCRFSSRFRLKLWQQVWHWYLCCFFMCFIILDFWLKRLPHILHSKESAGFFALTFFGWLSLCFFASFLVQWFSPFSIFRFLMRCRLSLFGNESGVHSTLSTSDHSELLASAKFRGSMDKSLKHKLQSN